MKIVEDIIQPQGAKIKPMEETLLEFGKVCESMQVQFIGSVLLASLSYDINWKSIIVYIINKSGLFEFFLLLEMSICH